MFKETKQRTKLDFIIKNTSFENDSYERVRDVNEYLFVNPKNAGKVNTPLPLVREMISKLPEEAFQVGKKVLDPACKNGIFLKVIHMIRQQLGQSEEEIQNDLYGFEPDPVLVSLAKHITGLKNIYIKDFIKEEINMKFDIIVGNPPYQLESNENAKSYSFLWAKFLQMSLEIVLKDNGFLLFVTPISWMSPGKQLIRNKVVFDYFRDYESLYINLDAGKYFAVGSSFSYYLIKKSINNENLTEIVFEDTSEYFNINDLPFLPHPATKNTVNIIKKVLLGDKEKINLQVSSKTRSDNKNVSKEKTKIHIYPAKHTNTKDLWFEFPGEAFYLKKVLLNSTGNFNPIYDNGNIATSQIVRWVEVENELEGQRFISFIKDSKIMKFVLKKCRWSAVLSKEILEKIPKLDLLREWTDEDLYKHFNLTKKEIKFIEKNV